MLKYIEVTGKTEEEAVAKGLAQLGLDRDDVSLEILERGRTGFLGIGSVPAKVKLTYEAPDAPAVTPEPEPIPISPVEEVKPQPKPQAKPVQPKPRPAPRAGGVRTGGRSAPAAHSTAPPAARPAPD